MTPSDLSNYARQSYNAVNDTHFVDQEMCSYIYQASMQLAADTKIIQASTSFPTVIGQRAYDYPSNYIALVRLEYNSQRLDPIEFIEDDVITLTNSGSTDRSTPRFYTIWNKQILLRPLPDAVQTVTVYGYKQPGSITISDVSLDIPSEFQPDLVYFMLWRMCIKDGNLQLASYYQKLWAEAVMRARQWQRERESDQFQVVKDYQSIPRNATSIY